MSGTYGIKIKMKTLAVCSGGLDCTSFLGKYDIKNMEVITFNYGQKAQKEIQSLRKICEIYNIPLKEIDIRFMSELWKGSQLTDDTVKVESEYSPSIIVPLRNGVMLMIAMSYAYSIETKNVIYGSHLGDITKFNHNGHTEPQYPDCTPAFANALSHAGHKGSFICEEIVEFDSPAIQNMDKFDLIKFGHTWLKDNIFLTWSCYNNGENHCGKCVSCIERMNIFKEAEIEDLTQYDC